MYVMCPIKALKQYQAAKAGDTGPVSELQTTCHAPQPRCVLWHAAAPRPWLTGGVIPPVRLACGRGATPRLTRLLAHARHTKCCSCRHSRARQPNNACDSMRWPYGAQHMSPPHPLTRPSTQRTQRAQRAAQHSTPVAPRARQRCLLAHASSACARALPCALPCVEGMRRTCLGEGGGGDARPSAAQRRRGGAKKSGRFGESVWFFVFLRGRPLCSAVARGGRPSGGRGRAVAGERSGGRVSGTVWHGPRGRRCVERPSRRPRDLLSAGRACLCSSCPRARSSCSLCRPLPRLGGAKVQVRAGRARSVGGRPIIGGSEARRSLRLLLFARARACAAPS